MITVAALYVQSKGAYFGLPDVDPWDEKRDARIYAGPFPVVAHPPCSRWCRLAGLVEARGGAARGEDAGCFAAALAAVRKWGGVLEHPASSAAWKAFDLPRPLRDGWVRGFCGGWTCEVSQAAYGHRAQKLTWLYYIGDQSPMLLDWRRPEGTARAFEAHGNERRSVERMGKIERMATPHAFRNILLDIARNARRRQ
jgi:hypothetical protein